MHEATTYDLHSQTAGYDILNTEAIAQTTLTLGALAMQFARVERVPRYDEQSRENDAEHSYMLALVAPEIARAHFPFLDEGLVAQYAIVHDLVELKTADVATFTLNEQQLAAKAAAEHAALSSLLGELPPYTADLLARYEAQTDREAVFVRLMDKLLPVVVDIVGPGRKVMAEDYDIATAEALSANERKLRTRLRTQFSDPLWDELHTARDLLADTFQEIFEQAAA